MGLQTKLLVIKAFCNHLCTYVLIIARVLNVWSCSWAKEEISLLASFFSMGGGGGILDPGNEAYCNGRRT